MTQLYDFPGGIHPQGHKHLSHPGSIKPLPCPPHLVIPLSPLGIRPCVVVGDYVQQGELIAYSGSAPTPTDSNQSFAANTHSYLHAPRAGTIQSIGQHPIIHASGLDTLCIIIACDQAQQPKSTYPVLNPVTASITELHQRIAEAGILGMGGAGFPTAIKVTPSKPIQMLIINGIECEPYISTDDTLMQTSPDKIIKGIEIIAKLLGHPKCLLAVEDNKPKAIQALDTALQDQKNQLIKANETIELVSVPTKYPSGGERQIIENLTGKQVPQGGIPADIGIVSLNVATAQAVYEAIVEGQPCIERIVTVTGKACQMPGNYLVPVGTPVHFILQHTQSLATNKVIHGGPMMGSVIHNWQAPITKATNCIFLPTPEEAGDTRSEMACIRCGQCELVCPARLLPQQLFWYAKQDKLDKLEQYNIMDCIECGACSYVCPSHIPLVQYYRYGKGAVRQNQLEVIQSNYAKQRFEARETRLHQEQATKQARRKQRAQEAALAQADKRTHTTKESLKETTHKQLKIDLALTRTKLNKAKKAAETAYKTQHESIDKLNQAVVSLEQELSLAQKALEAYETPPTNNTTQYNPTQSTDNTANS